MKYFTPKVTRRNVRAFAAGLLSYLLLAGQMAPLALASNSPATRTAPPRAADIARERTGEAPPVSASANASAGPTILAPAAFAPSITATKVDTYTGSPNPAQPGATITYDITITNGGPDDATNVTLTDTVDANTTLIGSSVVSSPIAVNDTYNVIGNVRIQPNSAQGLLANDNNPNTGNNSGLTASGPPASAQNGQVTVNADGSFSYNPPPGYTGTDSFTYTVTRAGALGDTTDTATVTLEVGLATHDKLIWFINNTNNAAGRDGRLTNPFNSIAEFNTLAADDPGDIIFIYTGTGSYTGGLVLLNTQQLIGQGVDLATAAGITVPPYSDPLPAPSSNPTVSNAAGNVITLANSNNVRGLNASAAANAAIFGSGAGGTTTIANVGVTTSATGTGVSLTNQTGTLTMSNGSVAASSTGTAVLINGGNANITFSNVPVSQNGGRVVDIQNRTGGTVAFNGGSTVTGTNVSTDAIVIRNNTGGASTVITFSNNVNVTTTSGRGLQTDNSTGNFTLNMNAAGNSISATGGASIDVEDIIADLDFTTLSSSNSTAQGLRVFNIQGSVNVTTSTTATGSAGTGVLVESSAAPVAFASLTSTPAAGQIGLDVQSNSAAVSSSGGTVTTTDAPAVNVVSSPLNVTLGTVTANNDGDPDSCVNLSGATGTLSAGGGTLTGGTGAAFNVSGGSINSTYSGNVTQNNAGRVVNVDGTTGGTIAFNTGTVTGGQASTGVNINNANGNVSFANLTLGTSLLRINNQAVTITNGTGTYSLGVVSIFANNVQGIVATNADGTLNSTSGTVDAGQATAVNIDGPVGLTTLGMTLTRVDSLAGSATGLMIQDTNGTFTVNGDGTNTTRGGNGSGGTIALKTGGDGSNTTGTGVFLNNAAGVTLRRMQLNDHQNSAVRGLGLTNFTLQYSTISGVNGSASGPVEGAITLGNTSPSIANAFGNNSVSLIDNCEISGGIEHNVEVYQQSNTFTLTISNSDITDNSLALGGDGILVETHTDGSGATPRASGTVSVQNCLFDDNKSQALQANALGDSFLDLTINASTVTRTVQGNEGFVIQNGADGDLTTHVTNNNFTGILGTNILVGQVVNNASSLSSLIGVIQGNTMTVGNAVTFPTNRTLIVFLSSTPGQVSTANVLVHSNTINTFSDPANGIAEPLMVSTPDSGTDPSFTATITNNTVNINDPAGTALRGIVAQSIQDTSVGCFDIRNNDVNYTPAPGAGVNGIRLRQVAPAIAQLEQGASAGSAATVLAANNPLSTTEVAGTVTVVPNNTCQNAPTAPEIAPVPETSGDMPNGAPAAAEEETATSSMGGGVTSQPFVSVPRQTQADQQQGAPVATTQTSPSAGSTGGSRGIGGGETQPEPFPPVISGNQITWNIGTLPAGKSVTITFQVTINTPFPSGTTQVCNQGQISGNFTTVNTDDPGTAAPNDSTCTPVQPPPDVFVRDGSGPEPPAPNTNTMAFTVVLSNPSGSTVTVSFTTADGGPNPATGTGCGNAGADYTPTNGTLTFLPGQTVQSISVPICSDALADDNETFLVNLTGSTNSNISDSQAVGTITPNTPGTLIISEMRTSGPGTTGTGDPNDEFIELYNNTDTTMTVSTSDGSTGWAIIKSGATCDATPVIVAVITNGTPIPARGHFLAVGTGYSLGAYASGNTTFTSPLENDVNVGVFNTSNLLNLSSATRLDAVGFGTNTGNNCDLLREGSTLPAALGSTTQYSFVRKINMGDGRPTDGNFNSTDFIVVSTTGAAVGNNPTPELGAPAPENTASPIVRGHSLSGISSQLLDPATCSGCAPNQEKSIVSVPNGANGTLTIRRTFTNNTTGNVTQLRFRVVNMTTLNSPPQFGAAAQADLRALNSADGTATGPSIGTVSVRGTSIDTPPLQPNGGGMNSSYSLTTPGVITMGTPLLPGGSVNVQFVLGIMSGGKFKFFINIEALP